MTQRSAGPSRRLAPLVVAATAALVGAGALTARLAAIAPTAAGGGLTRVDDVVELGVLAVGVAAAWWLAATLVAAALVATTRAFGRRWVAGERFVARHAPAVVRRGLALTIGAGFSLGSVVTPAVGQAAVPPADLGWVATQAAAAPTRVDTSPPAAAPSGGQVTVKAGDTLWAIAAGHLPTGATNAEIAAAWPLWYDANRAVVGDDPNQIEPGQVLDPPSVAATGTAS